MTKKYDLVDVAYKLVSNKDIIIPILQSLEAEDVGRGLLKIKADLLNKDFKGLFMKNLPNEIRDYYIDFQGGNIILALDVYTKATGDMSLEYYFHVNNFQFDSKRHFLQLDYLENVKSSGSFLQKGLLKLAGVKGRYLDTALSFAKLDFIESKDDSVSIDFNKADFADKIPAELNLEYLDSAAGILTLKIKY